MVTEAPQHDGEPMTETNETEDRYFE
jgi:hypothetical protein